MEHPARGQYGPHVTIDAYGCDPAKLADMTLVFDWLEALPSKIGMETLFPPYVVNYKNANPPESGVTGIVGLTTSHASLHTYPWMACEDDPDLKGIAFLDVFSCMPFDTGLVVDDFAKTFAGDPDKLDLRVKVVQRGDRFPRVRA